MNIESSFFKVNGGINECHLMFHVENVDKPFADQLQEIQENLRNFLSEHKDYQPVFMRYFLSDAATQLAVLQENTDESVCAVSIVRQPPLDKSKIALWVYLKSGVTISRHGRIFAETGGEYTHLWTAGMYRPQGNLYSQTDNLLRGYDDDLRRENSTLADDCVRTWIFVRDIDNNYHDVVQARKDFFQSVGLTEKTHYIASTGIEGSYADPAAGVIIDGYAVKGLKHGQQRYLYAPTHLNPTHEYGVTFERGVCVDYADRSHIFISGTASIDNKGEILYPGDIAGQTNRMLENIDVLLTETNAGFENVMQMIVYLRNASDYYVVRDIFELRFPNIPKVIVLAPICRPGWLVETECIAVTKF
jgi:enamine deaminase RidA (YjgF/YER057c/UK114 family)